MSYHPRIEASDIACLSTIRTRNSELWFIKNKRLEDSILGQVAKCRERYSVKLYALAIEGNHIHDVAHYPEANRAAFKRDVNSYVAKLVEREVSSYPGGGLWARRYSTEYIPDNASIEEYFFYVVLQPVKDGLVERISDYPGYNCFRDAICGTRRKFKVVNWRAYHERKRWNPQVSIRDFTQECVLEYARLPGYESLSQSEYKKVMLEKLEARRQALLKKRAAEGKGFAGREALLAKTPGSRPHVTKVSERHSHRPRVLSVFDDIRAAAREWYFDVLWQYRAASKEYRNGNLSVFFPPGTYRPPTFTIAALVGLFN